MYSENPVFCFASDSVDLSWEFWNVVLGKNREYQLDKSCKNEVLRRVKEESNILNTMKTRKVNWIGHILDRNCLLKHVFEGKIEGRIEVTVRRGIRCKPLLDNLKETRRYWKFQRWSTRSHSVEKSLWKRLWICHKTDYVMNKWIMNE
jgi:hypothetical protein